MPRPTAASSVMPIDWSTRPISSIATQRLVKSPSSPAPPNSSGAVSPNRPEVAHLVDDVDREVVVAVPLRGVRRDLLLREVADDRRNASCSGDSSYVMDISSCRLRLRQRKAES